MIQSSTHAVVKFFVFIFWPMQKNSSRFMTRIWWLFSRFGNHFRLLTSETTYRVQTLGLIAFYRGVQVCLKLFHPTRAIVSLRGRVWHLTDDIFCELCRCIWLNLPASVNTSMLRALPPRYRRVCNTTPLSVCRYNFVAAARGLSWAYDVSAEVI